MAPCSFLTLAFAQHEDRTPTHGHAPTRDAVKVTNVFNLNVRSTLTRALTRRWRRWLNPKLGITCSLMHPRVKTSKIGAT
jgi:hypothetical protein